MSTKYVKIYYGPCDTFHSLACKPQKLKGLKDRLQKLGYRVDLAPVNHINYCMLEMCGHEIFRCNIRNLRFNTSYNLDPVCQRAVQAVLDSTKKFIRARSFLWFWSLIEDQMFRNDYGPKDYWPTELDIKPFASCLDCITCCGVHVSKK